MDKTPLQVIGERLEALQANAAEIAQRAENDPTKENVEEMKALLHGSDESPGIIAEIADLTARRDEELRKEEMKAMQGAIGDLQSVINELRKPAGGEFTLGGADAAEGKAFAEDDPYRPGQGHSFYNDIRLASKGSDAARQRVTHGFEGLSEEGKAMTEGVDAQGGYLVRPQIERQIVESIELDNVLRGLCSSINVTVPSIQLDQLTLAATAGWVAEMAQKPESTGMTLASVTASVFTAAGLATVSNQLLADSNPGIDNLVTSDLAKRLRALEEAAFIAGTGSGQPLGILNTPGLSATTYNEASPTVLAMLDAILDAIADVETNHGAPTAILMHPRTWTRILKSKDAAGAYIISPAGPGESAVIAGRTITRGPQKILWGYPVVTSNRMPTNLGGGTESRIIVGDFGEALILDRQGVTVDESPHVYFTSNATVFRAEKRVGFTAARTPKAFNVIGGTGLAGG
jgi:HK97 family phage major capsid protein